jgi:anti-sigma-K factor RskA
MTTDTLSGSAKQPDVAAAELALGLLEGEERASAVRRQLSDPDFARDVERWRDHFASLFVHWPDVAPSPELEGRILRATAANDDAPQVRRWKWLTAGSSLVAAALALVLILPAGEPVPLPIAKPPPASMVVALAPTEGEPMPARYDAASHRLMIGGDMPLPAGRSAQLWAIENGGAPRPLGILQQVAPGQLVADATTRPIPAGTVLAISIEPEGGSPTGAPTGPVIATGTLTEI